MSRPITRRVISAQPNGFSEIDFGHHFLSGVNNCIISYGDVGNWQRNFGRGIAHPTISGTPGSGITQAGAGFQFNGSNNSIAYGTAGIPTQSFTVLWGGTFDSIDSFRGLADCVSGSNGWTLFQASPDTLFFSVNSYGGTSSTTGWGPGVFHHGAMRFTVGGANDWFRDGVLIQTSAPVVTPGTSIASFLVGNHYAGGTSALSGPLSYFYLFDAYLDPSAIIGLQTDPWQIFQARKVTVFVPASSGSTGTVSSANANDTVSASGTTTVTGSLATTNANDTCSASGTAGVVSGTVAYTNADDTSAASGTTTVTGSLARINANDTVSASGTTTIVGSSVTTNANDTCAASGSVGNAVSGSVNYTNANDSVSASGTTTVTGSLSRTNANDTVAASGSTTVLGSSSTTNVNDTVSASGIVGSVAGTVAYTNNNDACSASGTAGSPQQGGHYGGATLDRKRKKERRHDDPDKVELRRSLENLIDGKVEHLKEEIAQPEIPQEIKKQAAKIIKAYQKPGIDLTVINNDIEEIKTLLQAEIRRQQDEDEELLFMLL